MVEIMMEGRKLSFEEGLVEEFEEVVCDSFLESAKAHLATNFHEKDLGKIFETYSEQEICDMIKKTARMEISLYKGEL